MNIIKPQALGLLFRPMEYRKRFGLCVSGYLHVPLAQGERPSLWGEQSMWDFLSKDMAVPLIDEGIAKLTSEFLVHGYAYPRPERNNAVAARVRLGNSEKTVFAFGERYWNGNTPSPPAPFERMPLGWSQAYGGADFPANPAGKGRATVDGVRWLPNLELPSSRSLSPREALVPAGFGMLDVLHPQRVALRGTHDQAWLEEHSMGFPPDLSWKFFNVAPSDQWLETPLQGNEPYVLENLHPTRPLIEGHLPGMRVRIFASYRADAATGTPAKMREVSMRLSTVWFFPHAERMVLIFHGTAESRQDDASDVEALIGAVETLSEQDRRPDAHYLDVLRKRSAPGPAAALEALNDADLVSPTIDSFDPEAAARQDALKPDGLQGQAQFRRAVVDVELAREEARSRGQDPDALGLVAPKMPRPPTPAEMPAYLRELAKQLENERWAQLEQIVTQVENVLAFKQEHKVDMTALAHRGPPKLKMVEQLAQITQAMARADKPFDRKGIEQRLAQADLMAIRDYQQAAHMQMPAPRLQGEAAHAARAELEWLLARGIRKLPAIDLTGADLSNMDLRHLDFTGAWLESVDFSDSNLSHSTFCNAVLAHANLRGTVAIRCNFAGANLGAANLEGTVFDHSDMSKGILTRARLRRTELRGVQLSGAELLETIWEDVDLTGANLQGLLFNELRFKGCLFVDAQLQSAQFITCMLEGADFRAAQMGNTGFTGCTAPGTQFAAAQMMSCVFSGASAFAGSDFTDANLKGANLGGGNFEGSRFIRANLEGANLLLAVLRSADLRLARAPGAMFRKADLSGSRMSGMDLKDALLYGANLIGADLRSVHLFGADLTRVKLDANSRLEGAVFERSRIYPRHRPETGPAAER